jgi:hypothetical protein
MHFLCKNINLGDEKEVPLKIVDPRSGRKNLSNADWSWIRAGFFMKWTRVQDENPTVTLICFGACPDLIARIKCIEEIDQRITTDPFCLFVVILDELFLEMDVMIWRVSKVFGLTERVSLALQFLSY